MKKIYQLPKIGIVYLEEDMVRTSNREDFGSWSEEWE